MLLMLLMLLSIRFQPAISRRVLPAGSWRLIVLSNTMMFAQEISERQLPDRLFTCCSKCIVRLLQ